LAAAFFAFSMGQTVALGLTARLAVGLRAVALGLAGVTGAMASETGAVLVSLVAHTGQTGLHVVKHTRDWTLLHKPENDYVV
jgi:hypothetical protein